MLSLNWIPAREISSPEVLYISSQSDSVSLTASISFNLRGTLDAVVVSQAAMETTAKYNPMMYAGDLIFFIIEILAPYIFPLYWI